MYNKNKGWQNVYSPLGVLKIVYTFTGQKWSNIWASKGPESAKTDLWGWIQKIKPCKRQKQALLHSPKQAKEGFSKSEIKPLTATDVPSITTKLIPSLQFTELPQKQFGAPLQGLASYLENLRTAELRTSSLWSHKWALIYGKYAAFIELH